MESRLLASSDSLDGIVSLIERYWYAKPDVIQDQNLGKLRIEVIRNNGSSFNGPIDTYVNALLEMKGLR